MSWHRSMRCCGCWAISHPEAARPCPRGNQALDFARGERLLAEHTDALLGPATNGRQVRIMVTMPSEAADDYLLVHTSAQQGMDCMRINCAHDDAAAWAPHDRAPAAGRARAGTYLPGRHGPGAVRSCAPGQLETGPGGGPDSPVPRCLRPGHRAGAGVADARMQSPFSRLRRQARACPCRQTGWPGCRSGTS